MMSFVTTLFSFIGVIAVAYLCGYGLTWLLLHQDVSAEDAAAAAPATGYATVSLLTILLSSLLKWQVKSAALTAFFILLIFTAVAVIKLARQHVLRQYFVTLIKTQVLALPLTICILWPIFYAGADTYLGTVNTDFTYSLIDNYYLETHPVTSFNRTARKDTYRYTDANAGTAIHSGRFGGNMFALLQSKLFKFSTQKAMVLSIAFFLYCLPLSLYFLTRHWLRFDVPTARTASFLIGLSSLTCLSFTYCLIGQNSGLGIFPLVIAVAYQTVVNPTRRMIFYLAIIISAMFFIYVGMLPFALTPALGAMAFRIWKKQISIKATFKFILKVIGALAIVNLALLPFLGNILLDWITLIARPADQKAAPVFLDFATELFFPLYLGLVTYPPNAQEAWKWLPRILAYTLAGILSVSVISLICILVRDWLKKCNDAVTKASALFTIGVYLFAWVLYSFISPKGYFIFKVSSWFQFLLMLPIAYLAVRLFQSEKQTSFSPWQRALYLSVGVLFLLCNAVSCFEIAKMSLGSPIQASIVNAYNISGNSDYLTLNQDIKKYIASGKSIGLCFAEYVQTQLISYQLKDYRISILSNPNYPSIDQEGEVPKEVLQPDIESYAKTTNPYFHGLRDDYLLTPAPSEVSKDIFENSNASPLWSNKTFQLFRRSDFDTFLFIGKGWYKTEYKFNSKGGSVTNYVPFRWLSHAGEIYLISNSTGDASYSLSFNVSAAEYSDRKKKIEIWHNDKLIDIQEITGSARVTTKPFIVSPLNKIVLRLQEQPEREFSGTKLWNDRLFRSGLRYVNVAVSHVRVNAVKQGKKEAATQLAAQIKTNS